MNAFNYPIGAAVENSSISCNLHWKNPLKLILFCASIIAFVLLTLTNTIFANDIDTVNYGTWHAKDTKTGVDQGTFTTDSVEFIKEYTPGTALLRLYYTKSHPAKVQGKYAVAINIVGFHGEGTYELKFAKARWCAPSGLIGGIADGQTGTITIEGYDEAQALVSGSFSFSVTLIIDGTNTLPFDVDNGKFRMGRQFIICDANRKPIAKKSFNLYKPTDKGFDNLGLFTTDNDGYLYLKRIDNLSINDPFYFGKNVDTIKAVKEHHTDVDNNQYIVKVDNVKFTELGKVYYDTLKNSSTLDSIIMDHTTIMLNLVISIEWDAKKFYFDTLQSWLKDLSNYYYNVSDDQMCLNKVAIYDNKVNWDYADIQINASNNTWPCARTTGIDSKNDAYIHYPRVWLSNQDDSRNYTVDNDWLAQFVSSKSNPRTFAHEIGHYFLGFFDEYIDKDGNRLKLGRVFGYMDNAYDDGDSFNNEMSSEERYSDKKYKVTVQYDKNKSDCWSFFEKKFEKERNGIFCNVFKPSERKLSPTLKYIPGPNYHLDKPDCDVGNQLSFHITNADNKCGDYILNIFADSVIKDYYPTVFLRKPIDNKGTILQIVEGITSNNGKIRIIGSNVDDEIFYNGEHVYIEKGVIHQYLCAIVKIDKISAAEPKYDSPLIDANNQNSIKYSVIDTQYAIVNVWTYNPDHTLQLNLYSKNQFTKNPEIEMNLPDDLLNTYNLNYNTTKNIYFINITDSIAKSGISWLYMFDETSNKFFTNVLTKVSNYASEIFSSNSEAMIYVDSINQDRIYNFAIFSTNFPALKYGLDEDVMQASSMHSVVTFPNDFDPIGNNLLIIGYSKIGLTTSQQNSLRIFKWNENLRKWDKIGGNVDTIQSQITTPINSQGTYAVFTSKADLGVDEQIIQENNFNILPNPVTDIATIKFNFEKPANVSLKIYDLLGTEVLSKEEGYFNEGRQKFSINLSKLATGVYYCKLVTDTKILLNILIIE
jgi:hypothetical protein